MSLRRTMAVSYPHTSKTQYLNNRRLWGRTLLGLSYTLWVLSIGEIWIQTEGITWEGSFVRMASESSWARTKANWSSVFWTQVSRAIFECFVAATNVVSSMPRITYIYIIRLQTKNSFLDNISSAYLSRPTTRIITKRQTDKTLKSISFVANRRALALPFLSSVSFNIRIENESQWAVYLSFVFTPPHYTITISRETVKMLLNSRDEQ